MRRAAIMTLVLALAVPAVAQQQPAAPPAAEPDIAIFATVTARQLRFETKPDVRVTVYGHVNGHPAVTVSKTDRENLPSEVQPYVTYRDIGILLTITSTLPDIETILDEALGTAAPAPAAEPPKPSADATPRRKTRR